jgi:hypothetical protein
MTDDYQITTSDLTTHATNLTRITAKLDAALDAANSQSVPTEAFGIICRAVPGWFVTPLHDRGVAAVQNGIARAEEIRKLIDDTNRQYDASETNNALAFDKFEKKDGRQ